MATPTRPESLADHLERLLELEAEAHQIQAWHGSLMPGMLQSTAYAAAAISTAVPALPPEDVTDRAEQRVKRVDVLGKAAGRSASFVIAEQVLHQPIGGPAVLREQLEHMLTVTALRPSLTLQVLPTGKGGHPGPMGTFVMYQLPGRRAVLTETLTRTSVTSRPEDTAAHWHAWDHLKEAAASPAASLGMIEAARSELCKKTG